MDIVIITLDLSCLLIEFARKHEKKKKKCIFTEKKLIQFFSLSYSLPLLSVDRFLRVYTGIILTFYTCGLIALAFFFHFFMEYSQERS